jgi:hypothetical protein
MLCFCINCSEKLCNLRLSITGSCPYSHWYGASQAAPQRLGHLPVAVRDYHDMISVVLPRVSQPQSLHRRTTPPIDAMSINPSLEPKSLFEAALNEFEKRAGTNLLRHQIIDRLTNCDSVDSVIDILQDQAQAFLTWRGDDGKLMTWLKRTVQVLHPLSTSGVLGESIGLVCIYSSSYWHATTF